MAPLPRLAPEHVADLAILRDVPIERLQKFRDLLTAAATPTITPSKIRVIAHEAFDDADTANKVVRQLLILASYLRRFKLSASSLFEILYSQIDGWTADDLSVLVSRRGPIVDLLDSKSIYYSAKALDLAFDREKIFTRSRILTDIRPVFTDDVDEVVGAVVVQALRIDYFSEDGIHSISLSLGSKDVAALLRACQRAVLKSQENVALARRLGSIDAFAAGDEATDVDS